MSDDLISRKEALERLRLLREFNHQEVIQVAVDAAEQQINFCGTAFDKEKVIEELYRYTAEECELHECGIRSEYCNVCMAKKAIEIIEKGGIE